MSGDTAVIYPHQKLEYNQICYVIIEPGAITDQSSAPFAVISDPFTCRFTTRAAAPPAGATSLTVADDGSGDFCMVQGAVHYIPNVVGNPRVTITVRNGLHTKSVYVRSAKPPITVRGESREGAVIQYANNETLNAGTLRRAMFGVDAAATSNQVVVGP